MPDKPFTQEEIDARIAALEFKPQHPAACQEKNGYKRWLPELNPSMSSIGYQATGSFSGAPVQLNTSSDEVNLI